MNKSLVLIITNIRNTISQRFSRNTFAIGGTCQHFVFQHRNVFLLGGVSLEHKFFFFLGLIKFKSEKDERLVSLLYRYSLIWMSKWCIASTQLWRVCERVQRFTIDQHSDGVPLSPALAGARGREVNVGQSLAAVLVSCRECMLLHVRAPIPQWPRHCSKPVAVRSKVKARGCLNALAIMSCINRVITETPLCLRMSQFKYVCVSVWVRTRGKNITIITFTISTSAQFC